MSVIIKNAEIDTLVTKKVGYLTTPPENNSSQNKSETTDYSELITDFSDDVEITADANNDSIVEEEFAPEFEVLELGIKHHDIIYIHPDKIDDLVNEKVLEKKSELEVLVEQEKTSGFDEGVIKGIEATEEKQAENLNKINELILSIEKSFEAKVTDVESLLKDAIFSGVNRILGDSLVNDDVRIEMIRNVVKSISTTQPYTLRLSEYDYNLLNNQDNNIKKFNSKSIISDDRVELGGCIVDTEKGIFDGRLEVQLARLKDVIDSKVE